MNYGANSYSSDTPRTDAVIDRGNIIELCRELERELAQAWRLHRELQQCGPKSGEEVALVSNEYMQALRTNASRYCWLRDNHGVVSDPDGEHTYYLMSRAWTLEEAIDAGRKRIPATGD